MRLVDADAYKERNAEIIDCEIDHSKYQDTLRELIDDSPTIDAVPVVRCRDCKYHTFEEPGMVYCPEIVGGWVKNDWFCAGWESKQ